MAIIRYFFLPYSITLLLSMILGSTRLATKKNISGNAEPTLLIIFVKEITEPLSLVSGVMMLGIPQKGTSAIV